MNAISLPCSCVLHVFVFLEREHQASRALRMVQKQDTNLLVSGKVIDEKLSRTLKELAI